MKLGSPLVTERRTGTLHLYRKVHSRYLPFDRDVIVWLPRGYAASRSRYSVLYMGDGQNLFDPRTSFIGQIWAVDRAASALVERGTIDPLIVVGVYNGELDRVDEYTPTRDARRGHGGKCGQYARLLLDELKPALDGLYRTRRDREHTGLAGSSLGGLATLAIGFERREAFGLLGVMSPSVWWDNSYIVRKAQALPRKTRQRIWLDVGTREAKGLTDQTRSLRDALLEKGWRLGSDLQYTEALNARHNELAWARRVGPMLAFLFARKRHAT